jgi:hypothetical protein
VRLSGADLALLLQGDLTTLVAIENTATLASGSALANLRFDVDMLLRVRVVADACLEPPDVWLMDADRQLRIGADGRIGPSMPGSNILVLVRAFDCTRFPIERSVQLRLILLNDSVDSVLLPYIPVEPAAGGGDDKNLFRAALPRHWLRTAGDVRLRLAPGGSADAVDFVLTLSGSNPSAFPVREVVAGVIGGSLLLLLAVLLVHSLRNRGTAEQVCALAGVTGGRTQGGHCLEDTNGRLVSLHRFSQRSAKWCKSTGRCRSCFSFVRWPCSSFGWAPR